MKKQYLLTAAIATLLAAGCQKEQDQELVTLGAVMDQPSKAYIDNRQPCWNEGDEVYVNTAVYPVSAVSGPSAQIADVVGADAYRAIFPASLVAPRSNISNTPNVPITLPATQRYQVVDGHQRVDAPMGDYSDGGTLRFRNLCSILHVVVNNTSGSDMTLGSLKVKADNAMLSGAGIATVNGTDDDAITLGSDASHAVSLRLSGATNVTLAAGAQSAFDIYLPSFPTDNVTITLTTTNGYYFELTKSNVALRHNTYTTVTLNVDHLTQILAAELVDGPTFNRYIPRNATAVIFEYNSSVSSGTLLSTSDSPVPIYGNLDGTTWRVSTIASMINANPNCRDMFRNKNNLNTIDFGDGFSTTNVTDMGGMFCNCVFLRNLEVSSFNTENVTQMSSMFDGCWYLRSLDVSGFNTSSVTGMGGMFCNCYTITSLDVSHFNTTNVETMAFMFDGCSNLRSLDVSNFNTENVRSMNSMFRRCQSLRILDLFHLNTENVTSMCEMFYDCRYLQDLDFSGFNTVNVTDMEGMFMNCNSLHSLDLYSFNTANVTNMSNMFSVCSSLRSLNLSNFNTENVRTMSNMFNHCERITSLDVSHFNTENVRSMSGMFKDCHNLTSLNLSNFNTTNVRDMSWMFGWCHRINNLNVSSFNTENVTNMLYMFDNCFALTSLDLSNFNTENVTDMLCMFCGCRNMTILDLSNFDMNSVTDKRSMCGSLSTNSGYCTITCPVAVQTALQSGTGLPTNGVTFTWVRPTSK